MFTVKTIEELAARIAKGEKIYLVCPERAGAREKMLIEYAPEIDIFSDANDNKPFIRVINCKGFTHCYIFEDFDCYDFVATKGDK